MTDSSPSPALKRLSQFLVPFTQKVTWIHDETSFSSLRESESYDVIAVTPHFLKYNPDLHAFFRRLRTVCHKRTRLLLFLPRFSFFPFSTQDLSTFLSASHFEITVQRQNLHFKTFYARAIPLKKVSYGLSIIVPVKNEAENINPLLSRVPFDVCDKVEVIFVEGGSKDGTREVCLKAIEEADQSRTIKFVEQLKPGKGQAVREGVAAASHELIVILDGDIAIPPEELRYFYDTFCEGSAELLNASRFVYAMEKNAMPLPNQWGNRFFARFYSWMSEQSVKDIFAGTKMLTKSDYERIEKLLPYFKTKDPWGDLDILFGGAKLGLKLQDIPVHYCSRRYGVSNMNAFRYGAFLVRQFIKAVFKFKPFLIF